MMRNATARAGLAILEGVSTLNQQSTHPKIAVRVGIDSGTVVVGAGASKDADVFGETPNIAARVQTAAAPDTVLITATSHIAMIQDRVTDPIRRRMVTNRLNMLHLGMVHERCHCTDLTTGRFNDQAISGYLRKTYPSDSLSYCHSQRPFCWEGLL